jgi:hypothetical protein
MNNLLIDKIQKIVCIKSEIKNYKYIMKKLLLNPKDLDIIAIIIRKLSPDTRYSLTISANAAIELINSELLKTRPQKGIKAPEVKTTDIAFWLKEGILRGEVIGGTQKLTRYNIIKDDVENLILFMHIGAIQEILGLTTHTKHPDNGTQVIINYVPMNQNKNKIKENNVELLNIFGQLKNKNVLNIINQTIEEQLNKAV